MDSHAPPALALLTVFAACCATPAAYMHARAWAQRRVLPLVHSGVGVVLSVQRREHPALTALFDVTAFSVSVPFYGAALPLLAWVRGEQRRHRAATARA